jgi:hypothetical protein
MDSTFPATQGRAQRPQAPQSGVDAGQDGILSGRTAPAGKELK